MTIHCTHEHTRDISEGGYTGGVAGPHGNENRAAHGCVTVEVECRDCGARRLENRNGWHREEGPWGPDRTERRLHVERLRERASRLSEQRPASITIRRGEDTCQVSIDDDGYLVIEGDATGEQIAVAAPAFVDAARRVRAAWNDLESAGRDL